MSLPSNYTLEGCLDCDVKVGASIQGMRISRNGVYTPGYFVTTEVTKIDGDTIETRNSKYKIEVL